MSTDFQNKIDIEPILKQVNAVVKKGLNKLLYDYTVQKLSFELDKCRKEMELYKKELEEARKYYQQNNSEISYIEDKEEHILLNIEDISDDDSEISIEQILEKVDVNTTNMRIKVATVDINEDTSEAEDTSESEDTSEAEEGEEDDASEVDEEEADAIVSTQPVNIDEHEDDIETEESESEEEEAEEEEAEEEAAEEEAEEEEAEEEAEEEVFEIEIDDVTYYATNEENGPLYEVDESGDPGKEVGYLNHGEPFFFSDAAK